MSEMLLLNLSFNLSFKNRGVTRSCTIGLNSLTKENEGCVSILEDRQPNTAVNHVELE